MRRRQSPFVLTVAAAAALCLAATVAAARGAPAINIPSLVHAKLARVRQRAGIAVLLPTRLVAGVPARRLSGTASARSGRYDLELGIGPGCNGANACFVVAFLADRGGRSSGGSRVPLAHGLSGRFHARSCGASCAPPSIEWSDGGVRYTIQDAVPTDRRAKAVLTGLADSAIDGGPR